MSALPFSFSKLRTCRYFLKIAYIGSNYKGVQRLTRRDDEIDHFHDGSIQCALEHAMNRALLPVYGSRMALSSRTDAGVHAYVNTLNVDLTHPLPETRYKPSFITEATNKVLAYNHHEINVLETRLVPAYFHSRMNALWRRYLYRVAVFNSPSRESLQAQYYQFRQHLPVNELNRCHVIGQVDLASMQKCAQLFTGAHDFAAFSTKDPAQKTTEKIIDQFEIRAISGDSLRSPNLMFLEFYIQSKSFLYNQVRRMVAATLDVGQGRTRLEDIAALLQFPQHRKTRLSNMVPACGLYLVDIGYDEKDMQINDDGDYLHYSPKSYYSQDFFDAACAQ